MPRNWEIASNVLLIFSSKSPLSSIYLLETGVAEPALPYGSATPVSKVIDNRGDFEEKVRSIFEAISQFLAAYPRLPPSRRGSLSGTCLTTLCPAPSDRGRSSRHMSGPGSGSEEISIRKRGQIHAFLYFLAGGHEKDLLPSPEEELIDEQQFENLRKLIDPKTEVLLKKRICFLWKNSPLRVGQLPGAPRSSRDMAGGTGECRQGRARNAALRVRGEEHDQQP